MSKYSQDILRRYYNGSSDLRPQECAWAEMLLRRGIEDACPVCEGYGVRAYPSTATWHGGIGGQMITNDICDECWGSGKDGKPWTNLKLLVEKERKFKKLLSECALDLEERIKDKWGWPDIHPANKASFELEMALVEEARNVLK